MCGIAGVINKSGTAIAPELLQAITGLVSHRGPDGSGFYFDKNVGFGHRRLSVIDLTDAGKQPMTHHEKYIITYNGEIYNYIELREELKTLGCSFSSETDTEVILAAYKTWGKSCVKKFNGMWAFAIYDQEKNTVFCSRDHFGIKPFHYTEVDDLFVFGSEIKQVLKVRKGRVANMRTLINYIVLGLEDCYNATFFEGVYKLPAGHNLIFDLSASTFTIEKYYSLEDAVDRNSGDEKTQITDFRKALERSVKLRLRSDVKIGTCLSGGMDSSAIAAIASQFYTAESGKRFTAITAQSTDKANDETEFAKLVADKYNLDLQLIQPKPQDFFSIADKVIEIQEEPFGSPSIIMQYFVMKKAGETGTVVLLDGQGGDEALLGYVRYYPAYLLSLPWHKRIVEFFRSSSNSGIPAWRLLLYYFYFTNAGLQLWKSKRAFGFIKNEYLNLVDSKLVSDLSASYSDVKKLQEMEVTTTQIAHLLRYEDRNSMHFSVEARLPFLDHELMERSIGLPATLKIKDGWTKYILRKAVEDILPAEITWRKRKIGFEAPVSQWLADTDKFNEVINSSAILKQITNTLPLIKDKSVLWRFYNVARWEKIFDVHAD